MKKYILIGQENIHHDIRKVAFESKLELKELLKGNENIRQILEKNDIQENNDEWNSRENDYGFDIVDIGNKEAVTSQSEYDYSVQFIIQEDENTQEQKDRLELYIRRNF